MEFIAYDNIITVEEDDLDCLSIEALFAEFLIEDETGMVPMWDEGESARRVTMSPIKRRIKCVDGFSMSVQAGAYHYCSPRVDDLGFYNAYEVGYPSEEESLLMPYAEDEERATETVYGYVPVQVIAEVIAKHGGVVGEDK